jgi:hypothetical protein
MTNSSLNSKNTTGAVVQFRVDKVLMTQLTSVADRLHTSVGVLARQWVAERLIEELSKDANSIRAWQQERLQEIDKKVRADFEAGPIQILHIVPFSQNIRIDLEEARKLHALFAPIEGVGATTRINRLGLFCEKVFKSNHEGNASAYVQLFRAGQVESVRLLPVYESEKAIYGNLLDNDLIRKTWLYCSALNALKVQLPLAINVTLMDVQGYQIRTKSPDTRTTSIDENVFTTADVTVNDWSQVLRPEWAAQSIKAALDEIWNAAGFEKSTSFQIDGTWSGF